MWLAAHLLRLREGKNVFLFSGNITAIYTSAHIQAIHTGTFIFVLKHITFGVFTIGVDTTLHYTGVLWDN